MIGLFGRTSPFSTTSVQHVLLVFLALRFRLTSTPFRMCGLSVADFRVGVPKKAGRLDADVLFVSTTTVHAGSTLL